MTTAAQPEQLPRFSPTLMHQHGNDHEAACFQVLVLDDSSFDQARIRRACLETGLPVKITLASGLEDLERVLDSESFDIVFIDYMLPRGSGLDAQRIVQSHTKNFGAAIVMISSEMRTDVAVTSMKKGSLDCLDKDALDAEKLRDLLISSVKMFAEASRHWIGELLAKQRVQIAQDVARVVRDEVEIERFSDDINRKVMDMLQAHGIGENGPPDVTHLYDVDEPFRFR